MNKMNKFEKVMVVITAILAVVAIGVVVASWGTIEWTLTAIVGGALACNLLLDTGNSNTIVIEIVDKRED